MTELFRKLNWKDHRPVVLLGAPASFRGEIEAMATLAEFCTEPTAQTQARFGIAFAEQQAAMLVTAKRLCDATSADAILWLCYPKQSSKSFQSDLNRDKLWELVKPLGLQPNRQIAIDDDWSALRFKKGE